MVISLVIVLGITFVIAVLWARGIDNAQKNYPDYKGEDFLNEEEDKS